MDNSLFLTSLEAYKKKLEELNILENNLKETIFLELLSFKKNKENSSKPSCFSIKFSELSSVSWSPEYYNTNSQIDRIIEVLKKCRNIKEIKEKMEILYIEKRIIEKNYKIFLNEETLKILKKELNKLNSL